MAKATAKAPQAGDLANFTADLSALFLKYNGSSLYKVKEAGVFALIAQTVATTAILLIGLRSR